MLLCICHCVPCLFLLNQVSAAVGEIEFPDQGSNSGPLHWKYRVLTTEPQGEALLALYSLRNLMLCCLVHVSFSVSKSCPTLHNPTDCRTPGSSVLYYLPEFAQIHVHSISDAIQPSHHLLPSSPLAFNLK